MRLPFQLAARCVAETVAATATKSAQQLAISFAAAPPNAAAVASQLSGATGTQSDGGDVNCCLSVCRPVLHSPCCMLPATFYNCCHMLWIYEWVALLATAASSSLFSSRRSGSGATSSSKRAAAQTVAKTSTCCNFDFLCGIDVCWVTLPCHTGRLWQRAFVIALKRKFPYDNIYSLEYAYNSLTNRPIRPSSLRPRSTQHSALLLLLLLSI